MFQNSSFKKGRNVFKFSPVNECILVHLGQLTKLRFQSQVDFGLKILLKKKHKRWINSLFFLVQMLKYEFLQLTRLTVKLSNKLE